MEIAIAVFIGGFFTLMGVAALKRYEKDMSNDVRMNAGRKKT